MGDEHHCQFLFAAETVKQRENPGLHRHVESRGWLVGDQHPRMARQGDGDLDSLPHAATELMWIGVEGGFGSGIRT